MNCVAVLVCTLEDPESMQNVSVSKSIWQGILETIGVHTFGKLRHGERPKVVPRMVWQVKTLGCAALLRKRFQREKCIRTANLIALNPPRTAVLFQHQPRGWWIPGDWALSFTAVPWRKIKDTVFQFQEDCQWTSLSLQKPTWLAGPASLFHSH